MSQRRRAKRKAPSQCQDCKQRIIFVQMKSGRFMPVDPRPVPGAMPNVAVRNRAHRWIGYVITKDTHLVPGWNLTSAHAATCRLRDRDGSERPEPPEPATLF